MSDPETDPETETARPHAAGAFDIRNVIGALLLAYGVILLVARAVYGDEGGEKSDGVNANLWAGLALLLVGGAFVAWARLRPVKVPAPDGTGPDTD